MRSKMIGLTCLIAVLIVSLMAAVAVGQWRAESWGAIPSETKMRIITHDYAGDRALSVMCFAGSAKALRAFYGPDADFIPWLRYYKASFGGDSFLVVAVAPYGNQYWSPYEIAFTQGLHQFSVGFWDYAITTHETFSGGLLRKGTQTWGLIRISPKIDLMEPFKVWVGEEFEVIESFHGNPKQ